MGKNKNRNNAERLREKLFETDKDARNRYNALDRPMKAFESSNFYEFQRDVDIFNDTFKSSMEHEIELVDAVDNLDKLVMDDEPVDLSILGDIEAEDFSLESLYDEDDSLVDSLYDDDYELPELDFTDTKFDDFDLEPLDDDLNDFDTDDDLDFPIIESFTRDNKVMESDDFEFDFDSIYQNDSFDDDELDLDQFVFGEDEDDDLEFDF